MEEKRFPASDFDQSHALHDLLDELHTPVTVPHEHGCGNTEEKRDDKDQGQKGAEEHADTSPDGDTEDSSKEVDDHADLDRDGPCEVSKFDRFGDLERESVDIEEHT